MSTHTFVLIWGGGDEPEDPAVTVHATKGAALTVAKGYVRELEEPITAATRELAREGIWFDPNGDTHILLQRHEVRS